MAVVAGWDAPALPFVVSIWPIILRADAAHSSASSPPESTSSCAPQHLMNSATVGGVMRMGVPRAGHGDARGNDRGASKASITGL
jgi:hypothetical protein